ncbi:hypothetical protein A1OO_08585 [Enterovibrio norvegicus FF-33]|uniref:hypothetical protein n=1 Tax=Enterovibrio norvegicus TaxID=188144 RepID=UPI0002F4D545|nr:hypothetical protein [Enterovibrio norvegicus]OEE65855.1 hypothetical protein A1OO_08585 [Enterovibrio norvegicus FF-33]
MANVIKAPSMHDRMYVGAHGNVSLAFTGVELNAAAVDTLVEMIQVEIGINVIGLRVNTDGLGAGVKADITLGDEVLAMDVDVSQARTVALPIDTVYTMSKQVLMATLKGAPATGKLEINPEYVVKGY